jgi:hypothetical protein
MFRAERSRRLCTGLDGAVITLHSSQVSKFVFASSNISRLCYERCKGLIFSMMEHVYHKQKVTTNFSQLPKCIFVSVMLFGKSNGSTYKARAEGIL